MERANYLNLLRSKDQSNHQLAFELARNQPEIFSHLASFLKDLMVELHEKQEYEYYLSEECSATEIQAFEQELRAYFSDIFGAEFVEERFSLPIDFKAYLHLGCGLYQKNWRSVYHYKLIQKATLKPHYDFEIEDLRDRVKEECLEKNDTIWLCIGYWSDKHDYFICCDQQHPHFGKLFDYNDAFPYGGYVYESYCSSLLTFLRSLGEEDFWEY